MKNKKNMIILATAMAIFLGIFSFFMNKEVIKTPEKLKILEKYKKINPKVYKNIDKNSFKILDNGYTMDKNKVYRVIKVVGGRGALYDHSYLVDVIETFFSDISIDYNTFESLGYYGYFRDKNYIYNYINFRDKKHNYSNIYTDGFVNNVIIKNSDPATFKALKNGYAKDKNNIYFLGKKIKDTDHKDFKIVNNIFAKGRKKRIS